METEDARALREHPEYAYVIRTVTGGYWYAMFPPPYGLEEGEVILRWPR